MKRTLSFTWVLLFFISAAGFNLLPAQKAWKISLTLEKVIIETEPGAEKKTLTASGSRFSEDFIEIQWSPDPKGFDFVLHNKTGSPITIIWDKCSFVDEKEIGHTVIPAKVKFSESPEPIPPTAIPAGEEIKNKVYPRDYAVLTPKLEVVQDFSTKATSYYEKKEWVKRDIYQKKIKLNDMKKGNPDFDIETYWQETRYKVILALKINGKETNYHFFFKPREK
jgi:hypothetical protein